MLGNVSRFSSTVEPSIFRLGSVFSVTSPTNWRISNDAFKPSYNTLQYKFIYMAAISWIKRKTITHKQRQAFKITLLEVLKFSAGDRPT